MVVEGAGKGGRPPNACSSDGTAAPAARRTIVVATHELDEALRFAPEHLVLLEGGRVLAADPTRALSRRPRTRAVAERVGFVSFLPVVSSDGGWTCGFGRMAASLGTSPRRDRGGLDPLGRALRVRIDPLTTLPAPKPRAIGTRVGLECDDPDRRLGPSGVGTNGDDHRDVSQIVPCPRRSFGRGAILAAALLCSSSPVLAQIGVRAEVGFGGVLIEDEPSPITITIENRTTRPFRGEVSIVDDSLFDVAGPLASRSVDVTPGAARQVTILVQGAGPLTPQVELASLERFDYIGTGGDGKSYVANDARGFALPLGEARSSRARVVIVTLGPRARQLAAALPEEMHGPELRRLHEGQRPALILPLDADDAPDTWLAYAGVDAILFFEPDLAAWPNPGQRRALLDWVQYGGRLVLLAASRPALLDDAGWPGVLAARSFESAARAYPVPDGFTASRFDARGPILQAIEPHATARAHATASPSWAGPLPVPLERPIGLGRVAVACFDPLLYDLGDPALLAAAVNQAAGLALDYAPPDVEGQGQMVISFGPRGGSLFYDLLANENTITPSLGLFFVLALVFLFLIGPFDYRLLKAKNKLHLSPWTLLGYTALFSLVSIGATFVLFAPDEEVTRIAVLDLVEGHDGAESLRGHVYRGIYAPTGGDHVTAIEGFQTFGGLVPRPARFDVFGASPEAAEPVEQVVLAPGSQPIVLSMPFNSQRVTAELVSGPPRGSVSVSVSEHEGEVRIRVQNDLASDLFGGTLLTAKGVHRLPRIAANDALEVPLGRSEPWGRHASEFLSSVDPSGFGYRMRSTAGRHRHREEPPPDDVVSAIAALSLFGSQSISRSFENERRGETIWQNGVQIPLEPNRFRPRFDLTHTLTNDQGVLLVWTDELPFDDALADRPRGFTWVFLRRTVTLPESLR